MQQKNSDLLSRPGGGERRHLPFLDGMRGLAALYVVCHHFLLWSADGASPWLLKVVSWTAFGHFAVNVFIVISGFSLMLPVVSSPEYQLRGGVWNYLNRRAKRILPPYYAALIFSLLVLAAVAALSQIPWTDVPDFSAGSIGTHLLLIFNWFSQWNMTINMPMWSVATEWQIYFLFPLLLLPVWRRTGAGCILVGVAVGLLPHFLLPPGRNLDWACPWFVGLFAMGMTVASLQGRGEAVKPFRWLGGLLVCGVLYVLLKTWLKGPEFAWTRDLCAGAFASCLLAWCLGVMERSEKPWVFRLLDSRVCVLLGSFSYSLYLTHYAVLNVFFYLAKKFQLTPDAALFLRAFAGIPCCLLLAYAFYWCFERPFLGRNATVQGRLAAVKAGHSASGASL